MSQQVRNFAQWRQPKRRDASLSPAAWGRKINWDAWHTPKGSVSFFRSLVCYRGSRSSASLQTEGGCTHEQTLCFQIKQMCLFICAGSFEYLMLGCAIFKTLLQLFYTFLWWKNKCCIETAAVFLWQRNFCGAHNKLQHESTRSFCLFGLLTAIIWAT